VPVRLAILISGRGSNMVAIAKACASGQILGNIVTVISDQPKATGLARAKAMGLHTTVIEWPKIAGAAQTDRSAFENSAIKAIDACQADLVVLAGFMRILSPHFVGHYAGRLLNIHPSLLPAFKGLHTHARVLAAGDQQHGATVHYVTAQLDGGPLIAQARVPVLAGDNEESLSARVHAQELMLYPMVVEWIAAGRVRSVNGQPVFDGAPLLNPIQMPGA
jgi:phosphoribosylglycinamide formyltransferase 1